MATYSTDIDPAVALEILPDKIKAAKRRITELALDLSVIEAVPEHSEAELTTLNTMLRVQKAACAEYEMRLKAIQKAAQGLEPASEEEEPAATPD